jgi:hypothetical protein
VSSCSIITLRLASLVQTLLYYPIQNGKALVVLVFGKGQDQPQKHHIHQYKNYKGWR